MSKLIMIQRKCTSTIVLNVLKALMTRRNILSIWIGTKMLKDTNAMSVTRHFSPSRNSQMILRHLVLLPVVPQVTSLSVQSVGRCLRQKTGTENISNGSMSIMKTRNHSFVSFAFRECGLLKGSKNTWINVKAEVCVVYDTGGDYMYLTVTSIFVVVISNCGFVRETGNDYV